MIFKKKKDMIDISELQKQGKIVLDRKTELPTDKDGFVETYRTVQENKNPTVNNDCAKLNTRIQEMDRIIYKLEQRLELLEKKLGINNNTPSINW